MDNKISRRDALKRLGAAMIGGVAASAGLFTLSSCRADKPRKRVVLYFTGTGNSLYVARELAGKDGEILSIPQLARKGINDIEANEIGLVYPIYGHMPPYTVRQYIKQATLKAEYKFAVLTYGSRHGGAAEIWNDISRRAGNPFDYINTMEMVDNWLPNFDMNEQMRMDKHIPQQLSELRTAIDARKHHIQPTTAQDRAVHQGFLERSGIDPDVGFLVDSAALFAVTDACIGCGTCVNVCPRANYSLSGQGEGSGITIEGSCEVCFACIQNCPQKAILFAKNEQGEYMFGPEKNPGARYRNEHVSLYDIKTANAQKL